MPGRTSALLVVLLLPTLSAPAVAQPLAADGRSDWVIYHAPDAPPSVQWAAHRVRGR